MLNRHALKWRLGKIPRHTSFDGKRLFLLIAMPERMAPGRTAAFPSALYLHHEAGTVKSSVTAAVITLVR